MSAYSTLRVTREQAMAALMAVRFNPSNELLADALDAILEDSLYNVRIVADVADASDEFELTPIRRLIEQ